MPWELSLSRLPMIEAGEIAGVINACSNIWTSFPGNNYGQGGHSLETLVAKYHSLLGVASVGLANI
jgi:muramidase (phage lysozyme)